MTLKHLKKFKTDKELSLYMYLKANCNDDGFTFIHNGTLSNMMDKAERSIREILVELAEDGHIVIKRNVKQNDIYEKNYPRVVWMKASWLVYQDDKKRERAFKAVATPATDKKAFIAHIRANPAFPYTIKHIGGSIQEYRVNKDNNNNLWCHSGLQPSPMNKDNSQKVYDILWKNRHDVIKNPSALVLEELTEDQKTITNLMTQLAILKRT